MKQVYFYITEFADTRSHGSELELFTVFSGELEETTPRLKVHYTDKTGDFWTFYVGDTCVLLDGYESKPKIAPISMSFIERMPYGYWENKKAVLKEHYENAVGESIAAGSLVTITGRSRRELKFFLDIKSATGVVIRSVLFEYLLLIK